MDSLMMEEPPLSLPEPSVEGGPPVVTSQVIVLGGGTAALLAALVLARHVSRVVVVTATDEPRRDAPRVLGVRDQQLLDALVPGLCRALREAGAVPLNLGQHVEWFLFDRWRPHYQSALEGVACSSDLLDTTLRRHVRSGPNVTFQGARTVDGLLWDESTQRIAGVRVQLMPGSSTELRADLVVDATGRTSSAGWLRELGYAVPPETKFPDGLSRATRLYHWPKAIRECWRAFVIQPIRGAAPRGAVALPLEGDRLHVTLLGVPANWSPSDAGWLDFAATLPSPRLADYLREARPLTPVTTLPAQPHYRWHYERLVPVPAGLVVFGGTMIHPPAMQDDTLALDVLGAMVLERCLSEPLLAGLEARLHRQFAAEVAARLQVLLGEGLQWAQPAASSPVESGADLMARYMDQVRAATLVSTTVLDAWQRVQQGVAPPDLLFQPEIVLQVIGNRRGTLPGGV